MVITDYTERAIGLVPEIDTTVASQSSYTQVFPSGGSFQDVHGKLIRVVQDRPVQSPPIISNLLCGAFQMSLIIQQMEIVVKKSKSTKI